MKKFSLWSAILACRVAPKPWKSFWFTESTQSADGQFCKWIYRSNYCGWELVLLVLDQLLAMEHIRRYDAESSTYKNRLGKVNEHTQIQHSQLVAT
jgi:hypothetical protein